MQEYNGWENKFTWLVHLHLSNEYTLYQEITALVSGEPNEGPVGRLVEMWVKGSVMNWLTCFPGRDRQHDEEMRLLAWDLVGSALAYADWDGLMGLVMGAIQTSENLFTMTLYRSILHHSQLQQPVLDFLSTASSVYAAADACKDWVTEQVDTWIDAPAAHAQKHAPISVLARGLIQNTYTVVSWEHVARAFRADY